MKNLIKEVGITLLLAVLIFIGARSTIQTFYVLMSSMEPSFYEGQRLVVNKAVYFFGEPERGDVIIFDAPNNKNEDFIKRVIGLPGDTVEIKGGEVYVNDVAIDEPYIKSAPAYTIPQRDVPDDSYFVLGDNRNNSNDSHNNWYVPRENIIGKAWLSTWPPDAWGTVPDYDLADQLDDAGA